MPRTASRRDTQPNRLTKPGLSFRCQLVQVWRVCGFQFGWPARLTRQAAQTVQDQQQQLCLRRLDQRAKQIRIDHVTGTRRRGLGSQHYLAASDPSRDFNAIVLGSQVRPNGLRAGTR